MTGAFYEWVDCATLGEKVALRKNLAELASTYAIECLNADIADLRKERHGV